MDGLGLWSSGVSTTGRDGGVDTLGGGDVTTREVDGDDAATREVEGNNAATVAVEGDDVATLVLPGSGGDMGSHSNN